MLTELHRSREEKEKQQRKETINNSNRENAKPFVEQSCTAKHGERETEGRK
jgi:hypothetical protein